MSTLAKIVPIPKGDYNASATYNSLDIVRYNGKLWMCKVDGITGITPAEGDYWMLIVQDGSGANTLDALQDTNISSASNNDILLFNATSGKWENTPFISPSTSFASLTDVQLTSLANGQIPIYNSTSGKWENGNIPSTSPSWNTLTGKPFNTIDTNHFKVTNNNMSVHMPQYYVEVDGANLAGTYQTSAEPVVVPDGALSKPFTLILKNISTTKKWITKTYNSGGGFYVKEASGSTVYRFQMYLNGKDTYASSSKSNYSVDLQYAHATSSSNYTGDYVRLRYIPRYAEIEKNFFYNAESAYSPNYSWIDFMQVYDYYTQITTEQRQFNIYGGYTYLLVVYSYKASDNSYAGMNISFVACPNVTSPTPTGIPIKTAGSGISISYDNESQILGAIIVKASSATYNLDACLYRLGTTYY